jgi:hypothetical protein
LRNDLREDKIGAVMFRASFRLDDGADGVRDFGRELRDASPPDVLIVAGFLDAKTVEAYIDVDEGIDVRAITDLIALRLGVDGCDVTEVERLRVRARADLPEQEQADPAPTCISQVPPVSVDDGRPLVRLHPGEVTQVLVQPDGQDLSIQVRHRPHEVVGPLVVQATDEVAEISVAVGTLADDPHRDYVTFGVAFSWVGARLDRELGARRIVHTNSEAFSQSALGLPSADAPDTAARAGPIDEATPRVMWRPERPRRTLSIIKRLRRPSFGVKLMTLGMVTAWLLAVTTSSAS